MLSLHMMVLNAATTIERALRPLRGIVDEVVFTDTGSSDGTPDLIASLARELKMGCNFVALSPDASPDLYFSDDPSSFEFKFPATVGFTGLPQLRDWASARNFSLDLARGEYVLRIDADDEVMRPENVLPTLSVLDSRSEVDFLMCPYEVMDGKDVDYVTSHHFFWRNKPEHRFQYVLHEHIPGRRVDGSNWLVVQQGLVFRDWRDSAGLGVRVPHRNFKVLLLEYERCLAAGEPVEGHVRLTLADEGISVDPEFSLSLLTDVKEFPRAVGWFHYVRGECQRRLGRHEEALGSFGRAGEAGELRGRLQYGMLRGQLVKLRRELGAIGWKSIVESALRERRVAASCLIRHRDVLRAEQLLQMEQSTKPTG